MSAVHSLAVNLISAKNHLSETWGFFFLSAAGPSTEACLFPSPEKALKSQASFNLTFNGAPVDCMRDVCVCQGAGGLCLPVGVLLLLSSTQNICGWAMSLLRVCVFLYLHLGVPL